MPRPRIQVVHGTVSQKCAGKTLPARASILYRRAPGELGCRPLPTSSTRALPYRHCVRRGQGICVSRFGGLILSPPIFLGSTILVSSQRKSAFHCGNDAGGVGGVCRTNFLAISLSGCGFDVQKWEKPSRINAMQAAQEHSLRSPCSLPAHLSIASVYAGLRLDKFLCGNYSLLLSLKQGFANRSRRIIRQLGPIAFWTVIDSEESIMMKLALTDQFGMSHVQVLPFWSPSKCNRGVNTNAAVVSCCFVCCGSRSIRSVHWYRASAN